MRATLRFFLVLITISVILLAWITHQLANPRIQLLIVILAGISCVSFFLINISEQRETRKRRKEKESMPSPEIPAGKDPLIRSDTDFSLREKKSGLTWGGGNIKASEATRGTRRKFLGR